MTRTVGHRIAHAALALVCFTRAIAYSAFITPPHDSPGPLFLTDEGKFLWVYAALWAVVGLIAVVEGTQQQTRWAIPAFIGMASVWGLSYMGAWAFSHFHSIDWMTGCLYLGFAGVAYGAHLIITALDAEHELVRAEIRAAVITSPHRVVEQEEETRAPWDRPR